jgi:3-deoxy-D-manno-octulosonic-acid transferase
MNLFDLGYGLGIGVSAPVWLLVPKWRRKVLEARRHRMAIEPGRQTSHPAVMIHAVSLGEINATVELVRLMEQARPELRFIISSTTEIGFEQAQKLYGQNPKTTVIRFPLDFSSAVNRLLDAQRPTAVVLMELEVWPNFIKACAHHEIPVVVFNGRLTHKSYRNYRLAFPLTKPTFRRLSYVCAQDQEYADRFIKLGVASDRVRVTGSMKFDTAQITSQIAGADALAAEVGLRPQKEKIWVCGSTGPGEEQIVLDAYGDLLRSYPGLRLAIIPRKPERFGEAAELIRSRGYLLVRRSQNRTGAVRTQEPSAAKSDGPPIVLGDTMGELRKFYSLADLVFVGRTLVDLGQKQHGSDMIEPAALAQPIIVGPYTTNFAEPMNRFREADAIREINPSKELLPSQALRDAATELLGSPATASQMAKLAQDVVRKNQGATARNVETILTYLVSPVHAARP